MVNRITVFQSVRSLRRALLLGAVLLLWFACGTLVFADAPQTSEGPEKCTQCHAQEAAQWKASPHSRGVPCQACHGEYAEGHPATATMRLDNDATVCKVCHLSTYEQWQSSEHGRSNVTCTGCHQVHSQNLRMDSESLCTSCHSEPLASFPHNVHTADGVKCIDCHVPAAMTATGAQPASATVSTPNHVFMAAATTCVGCHSLAKPASVTTLQVQETHSEAESLLASQVQGLEKEKGLLEKASVVGVGLGLGFGAVLGIALTMIVSYAIQRRAQT